MTAGIRELKDKLSYYLRQVEKGKRVSVTLHGRVVAELVPPKSRTAKKPRTRWEELVASGQVRLATERGDPLGGDDWPAIKLPPGTAQAMIDEIRDEDHEWP